jgi:hypothetical protein
LGNGIDDNGGGELRPDRMENHEGKCAAEHADQTGFIKVEFEHAKLKDSGLSYDGAVLDRQRPQETFLALPTIQCG